jgi:hypothetical protein
MSVDLHLRPQWVFTCDSADSLTILKALGGRLNKFEVLKAKELGDRLTIERAKQGRQMLDGLERAEDYVLNPLDKDKDRDTDLETE